MMPKNCEKRTIKSRACVPLMSHYGPWNPYDESYEAYTLPRKLTNSAACFKGSKRYYRKFFRSRWEKTRKYGKLHLSAGPANG